MTIQRIDRLRNHGVFRDFAWPTDLLDFGKFNLVYGWNGSGKTTISRILRDLELRCEPEQGEVLLTVYGRDMRASDFVNASVPVRVFNRDFVAENVFPVTGGDVPPILILGEENIEKQKQLDDLREDLSQVRTSLQIARNDQKKSERALDSHCVTSGGLIRDLLRGPVGNPYNNYDKRNYARRSEAMITDGGRDKHLLPDTEREGLVKQHQAPVKRPVETLAYEEPDLGSLKTKAVNLLSVSVVAKTVQSLSDDVEVSDWVRQGIGLHNERGASVCLFCAQPLPDQRISDLEQHFNAAYQDLMDSLDDLDGEVRVSSEALLAVVPPNSALLNERLVDDYEAAMQGLEGYRTQVTEYLSSLANAISKKRLHPFGPVSLPIGDLQPPDNNLIPDLSRVIDENNQECASHTEITAKARKRLEDGAIADRLDEYQSLKDALAAYPPVIQGHIDQEQTLVSDMAKLEAEITEHRAPAEELNDDLRKYMGHNELQLEIKDNGYAISRNGSPASQLSEGETTAIALLYFLKSLTDRRFNFTDGVVVLDDPISSLDSNSLYSAFGLVQNRTKDAGQLFILTHNLTHNFTFFRQVRNWFRHLPGQNKKNVNARPAHFYMLGCLADQKGRYSRIQPLDPLLERFESDYHYLFANVVQGASSVTSELEANYMLPNLARRLLESFLAFRQPDISGDLWRKMQNVDFDEAKKTQILRFVHSYSHNDVIAEPEHDSSLLGEASTVLSDLLDLIRSEDESHYLGMTNLITQGTDDEND